MYEFVLFQVDADGSGSGSSKPISRCSGNTEDVIAMLRAVASRLERDLDRGEKQPQIPKQKRAGSVLGNAVVGVSNAISDIP